MSRFRKKPVVIEAYLFDNRITNQPPHWLWQAMQRGDAQVHRGGLPNMTMTIRTLEGEMTASEGDWIIKGIQGELYPCKPDIFAATYEPVEAG